jgi:hypothetical protein
MLRTELSCLAHLSAAGLQRLGAEA